LPRRLAELSESDIGGLRFFLDMARSTLDCLSGDDQALADKAVIWAGDAAPAAMVGATLLWADHYLVTDRVAELMISGPQPVALAGELRDYLALRPLIETGMVVPVPEDAASLAAADAIRARTEADLRTPTVLLGDLTSSKNRAIIHPTHRSPLLSRAAAADAELAGALCSLRPPTTATSWTWTSVTVSHD
jgi:hypothetical protein